MVSPKRQSSESDDQIPNKKLKLVDNHEGNGTSSVNRTDPVVDDLVEFIPSIFGQLKPLLSRFSAKVVLKGPIHKQFYNKGNVFHLESMDQTGKIKGKVFIEDCEVLHPKLQVENTYTISKIFMNISSPIAEYKEHELIMDSNTVIEQIEDASLAAL
ncbi:hypothetical protein QAD02_013914 [Eretmocerus hayati]|uniref:Uncharacterized protein n=1 Tax=Eretmocerus hayati TaxID=131215 RepID=A0ACC2P418_9HYME|nr:hypothetical protein QAD02_013914 [Eretmocerus hayati]